MFARGNGLLLHLSSLPGPHGIGDLGPGAYEFADMLQRTGQTYWQVLPLNPTNPENGESPYFSTSAIAGNPLLISLERLRDDGLLTEFEIGTFEETDVTTIEYQAVRDYKDSLLGTAFKRWLERKELNAFSDFCEREKSWLDDFALFTVLHDSHEVGWFEWPDEYKFRDPVVLRSLASRHKHALELVKWKQFMFFDQWFRLKQYCNDRGVTIVGDLPIYVCYDSADVWINPDIFKLDEESRPTGLSGVPPDYFSATGQLWNNPVYNWDRLKETGYAWWVARMDALFQRFDIVRIDHIRGLVQYWEVPAGETTAINGQWMDVPSYDFFDTMEKRIPGFPVIAEDLGTITPDVEAVIEHYGYPVMKVLQFAFGEDDPDHKYLPHTYEENCVAYTGTHDNPTTRQWLEDLAGPDELKRVREYLGAVGGTEETISSMIEVLLKSKARMTIIPVQDLLKLPARARMNNPAETFGNWRWRCAPEEMDRFPAGELAKLTEQTQRKRA